MDKAAEARILADWQIGNGLLKSLAVGGSLKMELVWERVVEGRSWRSGLELERFYTGVRAPRDQLKSIESRPKAIDYLSDGRWEIATSKERDRPMWCWLSIELIWSAEVVDGKAASQTVGDDVQEPQRWWKSSELIASE
jgi:hypothetical protein